MVLQNSSPAGKLLTWFLLICLISSCKKDKYSPVEDVPVNISIYTSEPAFVNLNAIGGWTYVYGGVKGIIVYRQSSDQFIALERACTYDPGSNCGGVEVKSNNITAVDTCCGSEFQITDGSVTKNPASYALKQYQTSFNGSLLQIFN